MASKKKWTLERIIEAVKAAPSRSYYNIRMRAAREVLKSDYPEHVAEVEALLPASKKQTNRNLDDVLAKLKGCAHWGEVCANANDYRWLKLNHPEEFANLKASMPAGVNTRALMKGRERKTTTLSDAQWLELALQYDSFVALGIAHSQALHLYSSRKELYDQLRAIYPSQAQLDLIEEGKVFTAVELCPNDWDMRHRFKELHKVLHRNPKWVERAEVIFEAKKQAEKERLAQERAQRELAEKEARELARARADEDRLREAQKKLKAEQRTGKGGYNPRYHGAFYWGILTNDASGQQFFVFGITNFPEDRIPTHHANAKKAGFTFEQLGEKWDRGVVTFETEWAIKQELKELRAIVNTGVEGFKTEATDMAHRYVIERHLGKLVAVA